LAATVYHLLGVDPQTVVVDRTGRLMGLKLFFTAVDAAIGAFTQGKVVDGETLRNVVPLAHKRR